MQHDDHHAGFERTYTMAAKNAIKKSEYNRLVKKFGKADPETISDNDRSDYKRYMEQRIAKCEYFASKALKKQDADAIRKGHHFQQRVAELKALFDINEEYLERLSQFSFSDYIVFDKNGQASFDLTKLIAG